MRRCSFLLRIAVAVAICGSMAVLTTPALAQAPAAASAATPPPTPQPILLWPNGAPGALGTAADDKPSITVYLPASNPTHTGVIIAPGGGYQHLSMVREGSDVAHWLNARGVAAFVLKYRLGMKYHSPIEMDDAQRAIRLVRSRAAGYGIVPNHIGIWGFSAGGHLAATTGTHFDSGNPAATDAIDRESSRPDFLILAYPVITMEPPYVHRGSRLYLLGSNPTQAEIEDMSAELHVTAQTPPTFIFATTDDPTVPVMNSVMFYEALVKAGVPAEMHLFQHGPHGSALDTHNPQLSIWPELLDRWMRERGYAAPPL